MLENNVYRNGYRVDSNQDSPSTDDSPAFRRFAHQRPKPSAPLNDDDYDDDDFHDTGRNAGRQQHLYGYRNY